MATIKCYYYYSDKMHKCKYEKKLNSRFVFHRKKITACRIWQNINLDKVILSPVVSYSVAVIIISVHRKLYCLRSHWNLIKLSQNCITYISLFHACARVVSYTLHARSTDSYVSIFTPHPKASTALFVQLVKSRESTEFQEVRSSEITFCAVEELSVTVKTCCNF